jgi:hypothetical protein
VISGWSLGFLVLSIGFLASGFWLYTHQPPPPLPPSPPYFISRTATAIRPCFQCLGIDGKLKHSKEWRLGKALEVPEDKRWWFAPVEEHAAPIKVDNIPMLAVRPAIDNDKPWFGFDQRKVYLVVFQDLEARFSIEHPAPPPLPAPSSPPTPAPTAEQPATPTPPGALLQSQ